MGAHRGKTLINKPTKNSYMQLKVMTYNVMYGFRGNEDLKLERKRLQLAKKAIKKENPDILLLCEAGFCAENNTGIFFDYKKHFGYEHAVAVPQKNRLGLILLSKYPIAWSMPFTGPQGSAIHTIIECKQPIEVIGLYPWFDLPDERKIEWMKLLLDNIDPPAIIMGDLNALSHKDKHDKEVMLGAFKKFAGAEYEILVETLLEKKLLPHLEERGYKDALEKDSRPTIPTELDDPVKDSPLRLDYILVTPDIEVKSAKLVKNKDTDYASDHYPITATLKI